MRGGYYLLQASAPPTRFHHRNLDKFAGAIHSDNARRNNLKNFLLSCQLKIQAPSPMVFLTSERLFVCDPSNELQK